MPISYCLKMVAGYSSRVANHFTHGVKPVDRVVASALDALAHLDKSCGGYYGAIYSGVKYFAPVGFLFRGIFDYQRGKELLNRSFNSQTPLPLRDKVQFVAFTSLVLFDLMAISHYVNVFDNFINERGRLQNGLDKRFVENTTWLQETVRIIAMSILRRSETFAGHLDPDIIDSPQEIAGFIFQLSVSPSFRGCVGKISLMRHSILGLNKLVTEVWRVYRNVN